MGKTKDVVVNSDGTVTFLFKDDACGENGVFDPGANQVGLRIDGSGRAAMLLSQYFFLLLEKVGLPTHFISADIEKGTMTCKKLDILPVEFIWRDKAWGSFCKMYGVQQGLHLDGLIETTLKDDSLGDPRINRSALVRLGKITNEQYVYCKRLTRSIGETLKKELLKYDFELIDFKVEFGVDFKGNILLADEISGGIWRIMDKNQDRLAPEFRGKSVDPIVAAKIICPEYYHQGSPGGCGH